MRSIYTTAQVLQAPPVTSNYHRFWSMLSYSDFTIGFLSNVLFSAPFILFVCWSLKQTEIHFLTAKHCQEISSFISIHLMGDPYFACHNEFEGINKHQLSGMYYNWKADRLERVRAHARSVVSLLGTSTAPVKGILPVNVEMNHYWGWISVRDVIVWELWIYMEFNKKFAHLSAVTQSYGNETQ